MMAMICFRFGPGWRPFVGMVVFYPFLARRRAELTISALADGGLRVWGG